MFQAVWQSAGMKKKPVQPGADGAKVSGIKLRCDHREEEQFEYWPPPTELQLAELAARLARMPVIDPKQLVGEAWAIYWESCRVIREDHKHVTQFFESEGRWGYLADDEPVCQALSLPVPKGYPVSDREAEILLLPKFKGRTAERARVMRDFIFADYVRSKMAETTPSGGKSMVSPTGEQLSRLQAEFKEEVPGLFAELRRMTFEKEYFARFAEEFPTWYRRRELFMKSMACARTTRVEAGRSGVRRRTPRLEHGPSLASSDRSWSRRRSARLTGARDAKNRNLYPRVAICIAAGAEKSCFALRRF